MIPQWERVRTNKGWHIRFRAANAELVVHGQNLTSRGSCDTAIEAVAAAHSPVGLASVVPARSTDPGAPDHVVVHRVNGGSGPIRVRVVDVDERGKFLDRWRRRG